MQSFSSTTPARSVVVPVQSKLRAASAQLGRPSVGGAGAAGHPVVSCYIHHDKRFAFVEFRTVEEASNAIALDGVGYRNEVLRVGWRSWCCLDHDPCMAQSGRLALLVLCLVLDCKPRGHPACAVLAQKDHLICTSWCKPGHFCEHMS